MANPGTAAATGAVVAAAAAAQARKASGAIVHIEPGLFQEIVGKSRTSLVVVAQGGFLSKKTYYLTAYKGLFFYTGSAHELQFPADTEMIKAKSIWVP
jgi:hypothetical protein